MKVTKKELITLMKVKERTFNKKSFVQKQELCKSKGYDLIRSSMEGRYSYYIIKPIKNLLPIREYLDKKGFEGVRDLEPLINALGEWNDNDLISCNKMAKIVGVSPSTVLRWRRKLELAGEIRVEIEKVPSKAPRGEVPVRCTDEEWARYIKARNESDMDFITFYFYWESLTGLFFRKRDVVTRNGFYSELFDLVDAYLGS